MEELESHCRCSVCYEVFGSGPLTPRNLNCGHTFCEGCIERLREVELRNNLIKCPTCKNVMYTHSALTINYQIVSFANDLRQKKEQNVRWSIRRPIKSGLACRECNQPFAVARLRVCQTCRPRPIVCPECALERHNGHSFASYENFLQLHDAEERVSQLRVLIQKSKEKAGEILPRTVDILQRLQERFTHLRLPVHLEGDLSGDAKGVVKEAERLSVSLERGGAELSERLHAIIAVAQNQVTELDWNKDDNTKNETHRRLSNALPVPPPRTRVPVSRAKQLDDRYSSWISFLSLIAVSSLLVTYFPLFSFLLIISLLLYLFFTRNRREEEIFEEDEVIFE